MNVNLLMMILSKHWKRHIYVTKSSHFPGYLFFFFFSLIQVNREQRNTMNERSNSRLERILVIALVVIFGSGAWVSVSGIWTELPILIATGLPEKYRITSIVNILIQFAAVGMIAFLICNKLSASTRLYRPEIPVNYAITFMGTIATFLLIFFWDSETYLSGQPHSVAFLCLLFFVALVDITSNVTFVGFMSLLKPNLLNWFWIGEGMSHILPAFVVLIQQSGGSKDTCVANYTFINETMIGNSSVTYNCTSWQEVVPQFLFEPDEYFSFLFMMMLSCHIAFICLNTLPCARREYTPQRDGHHLKRDGCGGLFKSLSSADEETDLLRLTPVVSSNGNDTSISNKENNDSNNELTERHLTKKQVAFLYTIFFLNFLMAYGIMSPILGYSGSAYGHATFQLLVPLEQIAVAFAYFMFLLKPIYSFNAVAVSLVVAFFGYTYALVVASTSPYPPFSGLVAGKVLIVSSLWFLYVSRLAIPSPN